MITFKMRAPDLRGKTYTVFTIADAPCWIGENKFVLLRRPFTPILNMEQIEPGSDLEYFWGDVITDSEGTWIVEYKLGFIAIHMETRRTKYLNEFKGVTGVRHATPDEIERHGLRRFRPRFSYMKRSFAIQDIIGHIDDVLVLASNEYKKVPCKDITQFTYVKDKNVPVCLGGRYRGDVVVMVHGRICVQTEFGAYDIRRKLYVFKEER